jgi:hypothetical protein
VNGTFKESALSYSVFQRIGYDADVGKFYFRDNNDGSVWECVVRLSVTFLALIYLVRGEEGAEFSEMTKSMSPEGLSLFTSRN